MHTALLPPSVAKALPPIGSEALVARVRFFTPDSSWTWYASEFDGDDLCFGLVDGFELEYGYFSLSELAAVRSPLALPIERDLHFEPRPLAEIHEELTERRFEAYE